MHTNHSTRLNLVAVIFGILLSIGTVFWGLVHTPTLAVFNLITALLVFYCSFSCPPSDSRFIRNGLITILVFCVIAIIQWLMLFTPPQLALTNSTLPLYDKSLWIDDFGVLLWLSLSFCIAALLIRSAEANRYFIMAFFYSSLCLIASTYFTEKMTVQPVTYSYTHGLVNPNNAASLFGVLLLLALSEAFKISHKFIQQSRMPITHNLERIKLVPLIHVICVFFGIFLFFIALLSTASRGGLILILPAILCFLGLLLLKKLHASKNKLLLLSSAFLFLILIIGGVILLFDQYGGGISSTLQREGLNSHNRPEMSLSTAQMGLDHLFLGVGLGNFPSVYPTYRGLTIGSEGIVDKAHNSYLELFAEMGIGGFLLVAVFAGILFWRLCKTYWSAKEIHFASIGGISIFAYIAMHSLIDFPMQIPSIAALVLCLLAAMGTSYKRKRKNRTSPYKISSLSDTKLPLYTYQ